MVITVLLLFLTVSIGFYIHIELTYKKYKKIKLHSKLSGFEVSRKIIDNYDLNNVYITESRNQIVSKYDCNRKVIRLTKNVFNEESLTSCAISSIEAGNAILDKKNDKLYQIKEKIMPLIDILLIAGYLITLIGCFFGHINTIIVGLIIIDFIILFHIIFYGVSKKSCKIALVELVNNKIIVNSEIKKMEELLKVSSYLSFASVIFPIVELIKKIIIFGDSNK